MRLIVLEAKTSFVTLRERLMARHDTERTLILAQPGWAHSNGELLLVLLRRLADRERLQVGLVSDDSSLRRQAAALGLPAFRDVDSAETHERGWHITRREQLGFAPGVSHRPPSEDQLTVDKP